MGVGTDGANDVFESRFRLTIAYDVPGADRAVIESQCVSMNAIIWKSKVEK